MSGDSGAYVLIVLPISNYQRFKNTMARNQSILANYTGTLVCSSPEVKPIEGAWASNRTMAILHFRSKTSAQQYLQSDPFVRQPDFMDGVDICIVQAKQHPPRDKELFVVADIQVHDPEAFVNEYSPKTAHMKEQGKVVVSAACTNPTSVRGTWKPSMIIINQWGCETEYHTFYNSDEYQPLKELRQRITRSNVITIQNEKR